MDLGRDKNNKEIHSSYVAASKGEAGYAEQLY